MLKSFVSKYIEKNREIILKLGFITLVGFICGIAIYLMINSEIRDELRSQMVKALEISKEKEYIGVNIIYNGIKNNIVFILIVAMSCIVMYGYLLLYSCYLVKGISLGLYTCFLFNIFGVWYGMLEVLIMVILVNAICLPSLFGIGEIFINRSKSMLGGKVNLLYNNKDKYINLLKIVLYIVIVFSSVILEQLMTGITINIYKNI